MTDQPPGSPIRCRARLPPGPWRTWREALLARYPSLPAAIWDERFARGHVIDAAGRPLAAEARFRAGVPVYYLREFVEPPIPVVEAILHVDEHLVVADKPHGLPVIPAGRYRRETLLARLVARLCNPDLAPLHRLDRGTAGLVLFSANRATRGAYQALFRERRIEKTYEALALPLPEVDFPRVRESRIERHPDGFRMREVAGTANARTEIDVLARGTPWWRYRLRPHTGRMHQLRVHLAALGAPIANDPWYPEVAPVPADDTASPLALLARTLAFPEPLDGRARRFESTFTL
jgi:tRNA pseudouridine32 synthase/23S rRNA pseudouridine746 synthase